MGFVKEKDQLGFLRVANLGQLLKQLRQHPQQKSRVQPRRVQQLVSRQHVDHTVASAVGLHEILDVEHRFAKKLATALAFNLHQTALNGAHTGGADVAILGGELAGVLAHVLQHGPQVGQVKQQQAVVVGDLEDQVDHAGLRLVEVEHAAQQQRPHVGHRCPHGMALFAKNVPQLGWAGGGLRHINAAFLQHCRHFFADLAGLADAAQVALHIGHEDRHADARKTLCQGLQRDGFTRASCARDEAMAIRQLGKQEASGGSVFSNQKWLSHGGSR